MQLFKSVYFSDHPGVTPQRRVLTLAFGSNDQDLFHFAKALSSEDVRRAIGLRSFADLKNAASGTGLSLNAYCIARLREVAATKATAQFALPEFRNDLGLDPIQATFRGGKEDALHNWFPYLEGYSPEFVDTVLNALAPDARRVLDPFGGTGTTPLTVARRGGVGLYCELNPVLQFLVETKARVMSLRAKERAVLVRDLVSLSSRLRGQIVDYAPDHRLDEAYHLTFGHSSFFPQSTYKTVLKVRSWLDALHCTARDVASIATIASVAALVPTSHLVRRGDLRFRKGPKEKGQRLGDFLGEIERRILQMASDLSCIEVEQGPVFHVASDAKRLDRCAALELDAVVTSPPYLNGTNYYRNTKLELWFMRGLLSAADLASFRQRTVTAGINDVTVEKSVAAASPAVASVVRLLEQNSYDRRIPQMVLNYSGDMARVFESLAGHLRPGAPLILDIGDSAYAGIHVDTPAILAELLTERGWEVQQEILLRRRSSRGGQTLRQVLLTANAPRRARRKKLAKAWQPKWQTFKADLPHQQGDFSKRNWGHPLHSLCSYQGKMKPSLAHHLVAAFVSPGGRVLDPFGGVGTIPFEAACHGAETWSFDISPAAVPIARAKLQPATASQCYAILKRLDAFLERGPIGPTARAEALTIKFNGPLAGYFHAETFGEILRARQFFQDNPVSDPASALVFASLLHVLHGNRPYALSRRSHPITPFAPTGPFTYKSVIDKTAEKMERALAQDRPASFVPGHSVFQDATETWPAEIDDLDAILTSPPFFDSTRFYLANWMRLWFAGWSAEDFRRRPLAFVDERQKGTFDVYRPILRQSRERLKPGGVCVLHLGKSRKCDMADKIAAIAKTWFADAQVFNESVAHCESHGISDKGTVVEHSYLVLS